MAADNTGKQWNYTNLNNIYFLRIHYQFDALDYFTIYFYTNVYTLTIQSHYTYDLVHMLSEKLIKWNEKCWLTKQQTQFYYISDGTHTLSV